MEKNKKVHCPPQIAEIYLVISLTREIPVFRKLRNDHIDFVICKITGYRQPAPGGMWVPGGGIVVPCTYKIYGKKENKKTVRTALHTAELGPNNIQ